MCALARGLRGERLHSLHGVDLAFAGQQPAQGRALDGRLQLGQTCGVQQLGLVQRVCLGLQQTDHPLRRARITPMGQQQAALQAQAHRFTQAMHDGRPQVTGAQAPGKHARIGTLQFGHRAQHAGRCPCCCIRAGLGLGTGTAGRIEYVHTVARTA